LMSRMPRIRPASEDCSGFFSSHRGRPHTLSAARTKMISVVPQGKGCAGLVHNYDYYS
jgi:hypothetical protein